MNQAVSLFLSLMLLAASGSAQAVKQPLYILLYARVTDHVNADISEDRLRRLLPMIETYQKQHPAAHVSAAVLFSGATSQMLAERNTQTHIVDFVRGYVERGVIEVGYDGTDEPTYVNRPTVDYTQISTPQDRWLVRWNAGEKFLTEGRDPLTGAPQPSKPGGLKEMQAVFGEAAWITGVAPLMRTGPGSLGGAITRAREPIASEPSNVPAYSGFSYEVGADTEAAILVQRYSKKAVMFGVANDNPAHLPGFRDGRAGFSQLMSPVPTAAPEVYWQDNVLRSSETSNDDVHLLRAFEGVEAIKKLTAKADRSRVHVIHVEVASEQDYLRPEFVKGPEYPALKYAYDHPQDPKLPASALLTKDAINAAYANEEALLKWVTEDFIPAEPGSRIVASGDLLRMAEPNDGFTISTNGFLSSLTEYMKAWGNNTYGPATFRADGHYLSRSEMFQVMADALAEFDRTGKIPASMQVDKVYGPLRVLTGHGPNVGEVSVASVAHLCAGIAPGLHDNTPGSMPKNAIPIGVSVDGTMINPAQFLRLMALALLNPSPEAKLNIKMTYEFSALDELIPKSRPLSDNGFGWTLKPAQLETSLEVKAAR